MKEQLKEYARIAKFVFLGILGTLAVIALLFLKVHWTGFMKFLADPAFFDTVSIDRSYQLKK